MGALTFIFAGCSREEAKPSSESAVSSAYESDPAFRGKLKQLRAERNDLAAARQTLVEQMKAKVDAVKARLKTDDEKLVKAELEKDPEWRSLYDRCVDANTAIDEQRRRTMGVVREKIAPKKVPLEKVPTKAEKISK